MPMGAWSPGEIARYNSRPTRTSTTANQFSNLFLEDRATRATDKATGMSALQDALAAFGPNYGKGMEMEAKAAAGASNITAGLGGTSMPGSISAGLTAKFEDARLRGQSGIQQAIASFLSNFRDPGTVTPSTMLGAEQLAQSTASRPVVSPPRQSMTAAAQTARKTNWAFGELRGSSSSRGGLNSRGNPFMR